MPSLIAYLLKRDGIPGSSHQVWSINTLDNPKVYPGGLTRKEMIEEAHPQGEMEGVQRFIARGCPNAHIIVKGNLVFTSYGFHGPNVQKALVEGKEIHPNTNEAFAPWFEATFGRDIAPFLNELGFDVCTFNDAVDPGDKSLEGWMLENYGKETVTVFRSLLLQTAIVL